jgi:hypothetical protein
MRPFVHKLVHSSVLASDRLSEQPEQGVSIRVVCPFSQPRDSSLCARPNARTIRASMKAHLCICQSLPDTVPGTSQDWTEAVQSVISVLPFALVDKPLRIKAKWVREETRIMAHSLVTPSRCCAWRDRMTGNMRSLRVEQHVGRQGWTLVAMGYDNCRRRIIARGCTWTAVANWVRTSKPISGSE